MSKKNVNPNQFKLFMSGTEWQAQVTHSTDGPVPLIWSEKESQARHPRHWDVHGSGVYESIKEKGYEQSRYDPATGSPQHPTIVIEDSPNGKSTRFTQSEGHHRVAAAAALERETGNPVYIPTKYVDNTASGRAARRAKP